METLAWKNELWNTMEYYTGIKNEDGNDLH